MIIRVLDRLARVLGYLPFAAMRKLLRVAVTGSPLPPDRLTGLVSELQKNDPEFMRRGIHDYPRYLDRGHDRAPPLALGENPGRPVRRSRAGARHARAGRCGGTTRRARRG
ncbi:MAG: hypothetical protein ACXV3A_04380 [Kineosporiaceae bacterium]